MDSPLIMILALRGAAISCLFAMRFAEKPVTARWLCAKTGYSENTVAKALLNLSTEKIIQHETKPRGWVLLPHKIIDTLFPEYVETRKNCGFKTLKLRESVNPININSINSLNLPPEAADFEGCQSEDAPGFDWTEFQAATEELFGEPVMIPAGCDPDPWVVQALVAEAYQNRDKLNLPARVVYANIKRGRRPFKRYLEDPHAFLPRSFLEKMNVISAEDQETETEFDYNQEEFSDDGMPSDEGEVYSDDYMGDKPVIGNEELPEIWSNEVILPIDNSLARPIEPESDKTPQDVWTKGVKLLEEDLPERVRDQYLRQITPVSYSPDERVFLVTARDSDVVMWVADRLVRLLERKLAAVSGLDVRVQVELVSQLAARSPGWREEEVFRELIFAESFV